MNDLFLEILNREFIEFVYLFNKFSNFRDYELSCGFLGCLVYFMDVGVGKRRFYFIGNYLS